MPGVLGGLSAALFSVLAYSANSDTLSHGTSQWIFQLSALGTTLLVAVVGGLICGKLVSVVNFSGQEFTSVALYEDAMFWEEVELEEEEEEESEKVVSPLPKH